MFPALAFAAVAIAMAAGSREAQAHGRCLEGAQHVQAVQEAPPGRQAAVPARFHEALARLARVARLPAGIKPELVGVHSNRSAFVRASGTISLSSQLWTQHRLDADEAAAVIAHELAHLELAHVGGGCETMASLGRQEAAAGGTQAILRAVHAGDHALAVRTMRANHLRELDADRRAAELLALAGVQPVAVGRMLVKLARGDGGGYSGSHPALETRLENLGLQLAN